MYSPSDLKYTHMENSQTFNVMNGPKNQTDRIDTFLKENLHRRAMNIG